MPSGTVAKSLFVIAAGLTIAGCGQTFDERRQTVLYQVQEGEFAKANGNLNDIYGCHDKGEPPKEGASPADSASIDEKQRLLWRMERGMTDHLAGNLAVSNAELDDAARLVDDRRTISATREVGTYLANDTLREYAGHAYEHIQVDYYRIMNHLMEGERLLGMLGAGTAKPAEGTPDRIQADSEFESAMVRARRMTLNQIVETTDAAGNKRYQDDPFARFLAAAVVWSMPPSSRGDGEMEFANVMLRNSMRAYVDEEKALGHDSHFHYEVTGTPPALVKKLFLRHALAYDPGGADDLAAKFGLSIAPDTKLAKGTGMLLVLDHVGYISRPQVLSIGCGAVAPGGLLPGQSTASFTMGGLVWWAKGPGADIINGIPVPLPDTAMRYLTPGGAAVIGLEIPVHAPDTILPDPGRVLISGGGPGATTQQSVDLEVVSDLDAYARATLKDEQPTLLIKTITRALLKQAVAAGAAQGVKETVGKQDQALGDLLAFAINLGGSAAATATENADIRAWTTLPDHIEAALVDLPAGSYALDLDTREGIVPLGPVTIRANEMTIIPTRTFPFRVHPPK